MARTSLHQTLVLVALASVAASCSVVFGDFQVGQGTGSGGSGGSGGCETASDCPKPTTSCVTATCEMGTCSSVNVAVGLTVPDAEQIPHDCQKLLCDGLGATQGQVDDSDLPDDGEICTVDTCVGGVVMHTPSAVDLDCAPQGPQPKRFCGDPLGPSAGKCVECNTGAQCKSAACQNNACLPASCTDMLQNDMETDIDCGGVTCGDCANGKKCTVASDCLSNRCSGATCQQCVIDAQCASAEHCKAGVCTPDLTAGTPCSQPGQCPLDLCVDGFCCDTSCTGACKSCKLPGKLGICSLIGAGQFDTDGPQTCYINGATCDGAGNCVHLPGDPCASNAECLSGFCADGVCCNNACGATCQSCAVGGNQGSCAYVPVGQPDSNGTVACNNQLACNGLGGCLKKDGVICASSAECISGNCMNSQCQ